MRAKMYIGTRVWGDEPRALYPGDVIEGTEAERQVALGNAEEIKEDDDEGGPGEARVLRRIKIEQATAAPGELRS